MCKKILIVDDDINFVLSMIDKFVDKDYSISIADSLKRAKDLIKNDNFDIILTNVKIPGGSGLDLKKDINKIKPETKILFMSGFESDYNNVTKIGEKCFYKFNFFNNFEANFINA